MNENKITNTLKYTKKINNEINRVVRNYNSKIKRLEKKGKTDNLPRRITGEDIDLLKRSVDNKIDLNRRLKDIESFSKRGGENLVKIRGKEIPKYKYETIKRYRNIALRDINKKIKEFKEKKVRIAGVEQDFTFAQLGDTEYLKTLARKSSLIDKDFTKLDESNLTSYINTLKANTRVVNYDMFKQNYLDILLKDSGYFGLDSNKAKKIYEELNKLDAKNLSKLFDEDKAIQEILYAYEDIKNIKDEEQLEEASNSLLEKFEAIYENIDKITEAYK